MGPVEVDFWTFLFTAPRFPDPLYSSGSLKSNMSLLFCTLTFGPLIRQNVKGYLHSRKYIDAAVELDAP
jgi:hypothetical protein